MESWNRKLRMGMVGGGQGAFIGGVHRIAATLDQQIEVVAGCFSRDPENTRVTGQSCISIQIAATTVTRRWRQRKRHFPKMNASTL